MARCAARRVPELGAARLAAESGAFAPARRPRPSCERHQTNGCIVTNNKAREGLGLRHATPSLQGKVDNLVLKYGKMEVKRALGQTSGGPRLTPYKIMVRRALAFFCAIYGYTSDNAAAERLAPFFRSKGQNRTGSIRKALVDARRRCKPNPDYLALHRRVKVLEDRRDRLRAYAVELKALAKTLHESIPPLASPFGLLSEDIDKALHLEFKAERAERIAYEAAIKALGLMVQAQDLAREDPSCTLEQDALSVATEWVSSHMRGRTLEQRLTAGESSEGVQTELNQSLRTICGKNARVFSAGS